MVLFYEKIRKMLAIVRANVYNILEKQIFQDLAKKRQVKK